MKKCAICKKVKEDNNFSWKVKSKNKRHSQCKECKKNIDNEYYLNSKKRKDSIRKRAKNNYSYLKEYVQRVKKRSKCCICGEDRFYVLDFHHKDPKQKDYNISILIKGSSISTIKNEIRKCIIVCSNCHREIHYKQMNMGI